MAYRFSHKDGSVEDAVRRIAREQLRDAAHLAGDAAADRDLAIHELRKAGKKVRALLRLVRPVFADYRTENLTLRDISRSVSTLRDASTLIGSFDRVVDAYGEQLDRPALDKVRRRLTQQREALVADTDVAGLLARCRDDLLAVERRSRAWTLEADGVAALQEGLRAGYRRARHAMRKARASGSALDFHEWRKRCKDHWYHARLFEPVWPGPMQAHVQAAHELGTLLGDHHDLTVFLEALATRPDDFGSTADAEVLAGLTRRLQAVHEAEAFAAGARLFAESPSALAHSWSARYQVWHGETPAHVEALHRAIDEH